MRRWQFSLRSIFLVTTVVGLLLVIVRPILDTWHDAVFPTVVVRVTSEGTVKFGGVEYPADEVAPELRRTVESLRSQGLRPTLLIEAYSNTKQSDVEALVELGREAGLKTVETRRLDWPDGPL